MNDSATLWSLVKAQAALTPEAIALECQNESLSYAELISRSVEMSEMLSGAGVKRDSVVALDLAPSIRTIVAMLAAGTRGRFPSDRPSRVRVTPISDD